jgi:hypothetical protein
MEIYRPKNRQLMPSAVPTMCTAIELTWLREAAASYDAPAAVVECGCWLGASTLAILEGLPERHRLHVFDDFCWKPYMNSHPGVGDLSHESGDDFMNSFAGNLGDLFDRVQPYRGDLADPSIAQGFSEEKIGFLFLDALKSSELAKTIGDVFFRRLIVNATVADQDFFWQPGAHFYRLWFWYSLTKAGFVEPVTRMLQGCMLVFKTLQPIGDDALDRATDLANLRPGEMARACSWYEDLLLCRTTH